MSISPDPTNQGPRNLQAAYRQLVAGAETLLGGRLFWTERVLLNLVSRLYRHRLLQLSGLLDDIGWEEPAGGVREALLDAMAEAALGGHDLGEWELVDNGYQARCLGCSMTSWIGHNGVRYSLLEDSCPGGDDQK